MRDRRTGDDDVRLLLLLVAMRDRAAQVRGVPKETYPEVPRVQVLTAEAALEPFNPAGDGVLDVEQVDLAKLDMQSPRLGSGWVRRGEP